ncbi:MAG: 3-keto-5-aminohexanoate cleavage protein [Alphaproteobacteria bacterium]|nr:3-keto-5-aminohexanoate cleavage protein [Alphaproteobacteria bacterium]
MSTINEKTVITCAVTGGFDTAGKNPAVPVTPEQIATSALEAEKAGASVAHIHVRDPETTLASMDPALYREVVSRLRDAGSNLILNLTTGPGARYIPGDNDPMSPAAGTTLKTPAVRVEHVDELRPEVCTLDVATMNFGEHVFMNTPAHLREMGQRIKAAGVKPELEVFEAGHARLALKLVEDGIIEKPPLFQLCLGIPWGAPATAETMAYMASLLPPGTLWSGFGIGRMQFPMAAQAVILGGHVRVGLEDNLYLDRGELAPSNAALVERAVTIVEALGSKVAAPDEARVIFGLKKEAA